MAFLLGCEKVRVEFPTKEVFKSISLGIDEGDRIGIVGRNGDGKSTLLALLAETLEPDEGRVLKRGVVRVGLLGQFDTLCENDSVKHVVVGDAPEYQWAKDVRTRNIIDGLLSGISWDAQIKTLSGGQRRCVDLARLLIGDWDVLALDEPTNHLDLRAIAWLAAHLKTRWKQGTGALLVVTHDRWFLDEVCTRMWEVHNKSVEAFEGGFSAYIMQRVERERAAALAEQKRQNALRRELAWLSRGARARATKPKFHVATAQALIADVPPLRNDLELKRMACARLSKQVVDFEQVSVRFGNHTILDKVDWIIGPGERLGIVGANGTGKTTLLRTVQGLQTPTSGRVKIGKTVRFAMLSQHLDNLNDFGNDRVRQVISRYSWRVMLDGKEMTPAQLLEHLGFSQADLNEPVCDLSGGQKRRLAFMLVLLDEPNVLILDEPGNDLDVDMLAAVEDLLDAWPGTLLLVTHDRYLMERVTDHQFAILDGKIRHLPGGVDEYLSIIDEQAEKARPSKKTGNIRPLNQAASCRETCPEGNTRPLASLDEGAVSVSSVAASPALSGGEIYTLHKLMQSNERKIKTLHTKIGDVKKGMLKADPSDFMELSALQAKLDDLQAQVGALEEEWLEAAERLG